ncbi:hypothetical protein FFLO_04791 [Filobasidium floriforme]|uniref:Uncharacterized protein n=1 Tax=Filobasidium floriforme TaxID=5210 RepID=A0A8K0JJH9_9TREE|nr:hypothetical protein FFLO_04791 [Filobasidium floriforme]
MGASKSAQEEMLGAAQRELHQRRAEESHYQRLVESLEEDLARSEAALTKIKAETQTVTEKSRSVEQQLAQTHEGHEQELKAARERFGVLDKEYDGLKEDNATLLIELEKMHSLLADTNRSAAASTQTETALHARIQSLETDIETLKKSISSMRQENSTKDNQIERLQRAREQLKDDKEMLNIALDSKQQEVELLRRKYGDGRQSTHTPIDQLGESISTTPAASRLAASVRRHTANRRPSATSITTPLPNQRALGRGTPSTINATRRFPSIPKSLNTPVDVSHVLNSSVKFNRKASLGLASARRSTSMTSSKSYDRADQESQSRTTEAEYRAMSLVPSLEAA